MTQPIKPPETDTKPNTLEEEQRRKLARESPPRKPADEVTQPIKPPGVPPSTPPSPSAPPK